MARAVDSLSLWHFNTALKIIHREDRIYSIQLCNSANAHYKNVKCSIVMFDTVKESALNSSLFFADEP